MTEQQERAEAIRALEGSFSLLFGQMRRLYAEAAEAASPGLAPGTFKVMGMVHRLAPVSLSVLAERMAADKGLMSRAISELEAHGLAERTADPHDGRIRLVALTALGEERLEAVRGPYMNKLGDVMTTWPLDAVRRLTGLLEALATGELPPAD